MENNSIMNFNNYMKSLKAHNVQWHGDFMPNIPKQ